MILYSETYEASFLPKEPIIAKIPVIARNPKTERTGLDNETITRRKEAILILAKVVEGCYTQLLYNET